VRVARTLNPDTRRKMCATELDAGAQSEGVYCGGVRCAETLIAHPMCGVCVWGGGGGLALDLQ
jgi:hypothetical protein